MKKQILGAVFISALSAAAIAAEGAAVPFTELDTNRDNALSAVEAVELPGIASQWSELDKDGDGQLSTDEYTAYQMPAPAAGTR